MLCFLSIVSNAQLKLFDDYYFDCLTSSYTMNLGITLASPKGSFTKANELLNADFLRNNITESTQIQALLLHNTLGYDKAVDHINKAFISNEEKDFTQLWLHFYTNNHPVYDTMLIAFQKKYPTNYNPIKLKLRAVLNYRDANRWNELKDKKTKSITTIDSLITTPTVKQEDKVFFTLMKLDFLKKNDFRSEEKEHNIEELLDVLVDVYQKNKPLFEPETLKNNLEKSESKKYKSLIQEIKNEQLKKVNSTSTEKVLSFLLEYNQNGKNTSVKDLESSINNILSDEKNELEISKIKALISVFSLPKLPDFGFFLKEIFKPIPFSNSFKSKAVTLLNKPELVNNFMIILKESQYETIDINDPKIKEELEIIKNLSAEDIQAFYGVVIFSSYYVKSIQSLKYVFGNFQESPQNKDIQSIESYLAFLEKNPLYLNESTYHFTFLELKNDDDIQKFITELNHLKHKFPGAATILKNGLICLGLNTGNISENYLQQFYVHYFKLVADYLAVAKIINTKKDYDLDLFSGMLDYNKDYHYKTNFENFFNEFTASGKKECINYLDTLLQVYPTNNNLKDLKSKMNLN